MRRAGWIRLALLLALAGCAGQTPAGPDPVVRAGLWGGDHVSLTVDAANAVVEFDCAHGTLPVPISLDGNGRFDVSGVFVLEHGGPIREGEVLVERPARYRGAVNGSRMTLEVLVDNTLDVGTYQLTFATTGRLFKCL